MDKNVLRYLADVALVRQQVNNILGVGRGVIDQKSLHKISAKSSQLDKLFVEVLLSGQVPGEAPSSVVVNTNDDDYIDINKRIQEAKLKLNNPQAEVKKTPVIRPDEEVDAFKQLLAEAENKVEAEKPKARRKKKSK